ncbi:ATP-binding cassette domain-containing protein [Martelella soudanensis]|uniref:ATP-binding cassette domain-containing protein n=1 Tax=Martelella sp. NC18 TaxID=2740297 RepID=UPI0035302635
MNGRGIKIANVRKHFGGTEILQGIDLDIQPGEFLTLLGPSGCGKSTLLRMIAGFEQLSSGSIHIGAQEITQLPPKKRDVAMVFQSYALYPHMSVAKNIGMPLEMSRLSFRQRLPGSRLLSRKVRQTHREIAQSVARVAGSSTFSICWIANRRSCPGAETTRGRWARHCPAAIGLSHG